MTDQFDIIATLWDWKDGKARLIATAPDWHEACEALINYRKKAGALNFQLEKADDYLRNIEAAIAKAKGE